jgi:hypothetical protein
MEPILLKLGCKLQWRYCIQHTGQCTSCADIAEEIARFYGYNNIIPSWSLGQSVTQVQEHMTRMLNSYP